MIEYFSSCCPWCACTEMCGQGVTENGAMMAMGHMVPEVERCPGPWSALPDLSSAHICLCFSAMSCNTRARFQQPAKRPKKCVTSNVPTLQARNVRGHFGRGMLWGWELQGLPRNRCFSKTRLFGYTLGSRNSKQFLGVGHSRHGALLGHSRDSLKIYSGVGDGCWRGVDRASTKI